MLFSIRKFKELRAQRGFTQKEIADLLGVKQNTVSTWESGERKPSDVKIHQIAKELNISPSDITISSDKDKPLYLEPLDELMLRKFRNLDHKGKIFLLEITPEKYHALLDEIENYKSIIDNMSESLTKKVS